MAGRRRPRDGAPFGRAISDETRTPALVATIPIAEHPPLPDRRAECLSSMASSSRACVSPNNSIFCPLRFHLLVTARVAMSRTQRHVVVEMLIAAWSRSCLKKIGIRCRPR